ncbi:MAG TPA: helix-turn-helix domain-containing protein [Solirubrobacteraceae bacterium]|nr:helix-turn-helix domain-containing protein [Solirubrobacteraceae bacterium]
MSTKEAADLVGVSPRTVTNWADAGKVPYLKLPGGEYRIPLAGFLAAMEGTYDLAAELEKVQQSALERAENDVTRGLDAET